MRTQLYEVRLVCGKHRQTHYAEVNATNALHALMQVIPTHAPVYEILGVSRIISIERSDKQELLAACQAVVKYHRENDSGEGELFGLDFVTTCIAAIAKVEGD